MYCFALDLFEENMSEKENALHCQGDTKSLDQINRVSPNKDVTGAHIPLISHIHLVVDKR
jgi:hypothetical protein